MLTNRLKDLQNFQPSILANGLKDLQKLQSLNLHVLHAMMLNVEEEEAIYEDGLSTITADEYIMKRLIPILAEFNSTTPVLSMSVYAVKLIGIAFSVGSSIIAYVYII